MQGAWFVVARLYAWEAAKQKEQPGTQSRLLKS
jgi:hypothetical protein